MVEAWLLRGGVYIEKAWRCTERNMEVHLEPIKLIGDVHRENIVCYSLVNAMH